MLANLLKDTAYEEVRVVGVVTDICVISNCIMIKSALPEALIEVDTKGCASFDENLEKAALTVLEKSLQVKVIQCYFSVFHKLYKLFCIISSFCIASSK